MAMVLGKLPVPGRPTIWIIVGQGPAALAVGAGGGCLDIFTLICPFFLLSPSHWETARYRLKYCLKGPLNQNQPTNQHIYIVLITDEISLDKDSINYVIVFLFLLPCDAINHVTRTDVKNMFSIFQLFLFYFILSRSH